MKNEWCGGAVGTLEQLKDAEAIGYRFVEKFHFTNRPAVVCGGAWWSVDESVAEQYMNEHKPTAGRRRTGETWGELISGCDATDDPDDFDRVGENAPQMRY